MRFKRLLIPDEQGFQTISKNRNMSEIQGFTQSTIVKTIC